MAQTIFITGASSGIGKATALYFAAKGWNVAATMRNPDKETELTKRGNIKVLRLDVLDESSIKQAVGEVVQAFGGIDVLFNNAGYGLAGPFEAISNEQIKRQFETNLFGVMNVTRTVLPYFRKKRNGLIISTSSIGGRVTFPLFSLYHSTKWGLEGFMESLHYELRPFGIKVKIIEPGLIRTDFAGRSLELVTSPEFKEYDAYVDVARKNLESGDAMASPPEVVAAGVFKACIDGKNKLRYPVGGRAPMLLFIRWLLPLNTFFGMIRGQVEKGFKG